VKEAEEHHIFKGTFRSRRKLRWTLAVKHVMILLQTGARRQTETSN
jgi:hypothetical protein